MKTFGLAAILYLVCLVPGKAQWDKLDIGFVSSPNVCPFISDDTNIPQTARLGFALGSFLRTKASDKISFDLGLSYVVRSYKIDVDDISQDPDDPLPVGEGNIIFKYSSLDVPVEINYKMNRKENFDCYLSGGLVNSFGLVWKAEPSWEATNLDGSLEGYYQLTVRSGLGFMFKTTEVNFGVEPQVGYTFLQEKWSDSKPMYFGLEFFILLN